MQYLWIFKITPVRGVPWVEYQLFVARDPYLCLAKNSSSLLWLLWQIIRGKISVVRLLEREMRILQDALGADTLDRCIGRGIDCKLGTPATAQQQTERFISEAVLSWMMAQCASHNKMIAFAFALAYGSLRASDDPLSGPGLLLIILSQLVV